MEGILPMSRFTRLFGIVLLFAAALAVGMAEAQDKSGKAEVFKDRDAFLPKRKFPPLPATVVGLLIEGGQGLMNSEGRKGPSDALAFSSGDGSYRWMYVPDKNRPLIGALNVPVGPKGEEKKRFTSLNMASLKSLEQFGIKQANVLVEVEVNGGLGSPPGETFVATKVRPLEGTNAYPFRTSDLIAQVQKVYEGYLKEKGSEIEKAMKEAQAKALPNAKPTGPREKTDLAFVTWQPQSQRLVIRLRTQVTDGAYRTTTIKEEILEIGNTKPVIKPKEIRFGKSFGVELGMAYEISKSGKIERSQELPIQTFQKEIPPPSDDKD